MKNADILIPTAVAALIPLLQLPTWLLTIPAAGLISAAIRRKLEQRWAS